MRRYVPGIGRLRGTLLLTAIALVTLGATASGAAAQLNVYVGYADTLRAHPSHFPTPWAPSVHVYGTKCSKKQACDNSTIRLVNNSKKTVTVKSVVVKFSTCTFNSWPHNLKIRPGKQVVLSSEGRRGIKGCSTKIHGFDGSEIGPQGKAWNGHCNNSHVIPQVILTTTGGTSKFRDTAQVLNSGGYDKAKCGKKKRNESTQWNLIGRQACPSANLTLKPTTQKVALGSKAKLVATLRNSGGKHCGQPLRGEKVSFRVLTGPNKGKAGTAVTNKRGKATFTYTGTKTGTDTVRAKANNPVGSINSHKATVTWAKSKHHHGGHRAGTFSCEATGADLLGSTFAVANPTNSPCATDQASVLNVNSVPKITVGVIKSNTFAKYGKQVKAGDTAEATSKVASASTRLISGHPIKIGAAQSTATETCVAKAGKLSLKQTGKSTVAYIVINGTKTVIGNKYKKIVVGPTATPLATIYLNRKIKTGGTLTQRAVEIDIGGTTQSIILAQSEVDLTGNPCTTA
jgi:hypothetical protein